MKYVPPSIRFWRFVSKGDPNECWVWTGFRYKKGLAYGQFEEGTSPPMRRTVRAHRYSWVLHNGEIPSGMQVLHRCDNPGCVNPNHLFLGTQKQNIEDMVRKGRASMGEKAGGAKLTSDQVIEIRSLHKSGVKQNVIARQFGMGKMEISRIVRRLRWAHI